MATPPRTQITEQGLDGLGNPVATTRMTAWVAPPYAATPFTTLADIFVAETGVQEVANPLDSGVTGILRGWLGAGSYDIKVEDSSGNNAFPTRIYRYDSVPWDHGIIDQMVADDVVTKPKIAISSGWIAKMADGSIPAGKVNTMLAGTMIVQGSTVSVDADIWDFAKNNNARTGNVISAVSGGLNTDVFYASVSTSLPNPAKLFILTNCHWATTGTTPTVTMRPYLSDSNFQGPTGVARKVTADRGNIFNPWFVDTTGLNGLPSLGVIVNSSQNITHTVETFVWRVG